MRPYSPTMILGPWPRIYSMRTLASGRSQSRLGAGVRIAVTRGTDQGNRAMHESLKISGLWLRMNPMRSLPRGTQTQFAVVPDRTAANERTMNDSICSAGSRIGARRVEGLLHRDLWVRNDAQVRGSESRFYTQQHKQGVRKPDRAEILARQDDVSRTGGEQFRPLSCHLSGLAFATSGARLHQDRGQDLVPGGVHRLLGGIADQENEQCHCG